MRAAPISVLQYLLYKRTGSWAIQARFENHKTDALGCTIQEETPTVSLAIVRSCGAAFDEGIGVAAPTDSKDGPGHVVFSAQLDSDDHR